MLTIPLELPTATHLSFPNALGPPPRPPNATTVVPTAPSSIHVAIARLSRLSHSTTSPPLPTSIKPSPSPHQSKSATPPLPSTLTSAIHWQLFVSRTLIVPPPFRPEPTKPIQRPHGLSLKRSILRCTSPCPIIRDTFSTFPVSRFQI